MIKLAVLSLCMVMGAQAHVTRFPLEKQLSELYFDVEIEASRIYMQKLAEEYVLWLHEVNACIENRQDAVYLTRISHMFGEVYTTYQFGN